MKPFITTNFYTFTPCQRVLMIRIRSSWDERVVDQYLVDLKKTKDKFFSRHPWAVISDLSHWELNTPEAENKIWEAHNSFQNNPTHAAIVTGTSEAKRWQVGNMFRDVDNFTFRLFIHRNDAAKWLRHLGYELPE